MCRLRRLSLWTVFRPGSGFCTTSRLPPLIHAALVYAQFEAIHPFLDGNGRIGRLLITLLLAQRGVLPQPLLYLSAYFERTRQDYYSHLLHIIERGEWEEWLVYFLNGVAAQTGETIEKDAPHRRASVRMEAGSCP